MIGGIVIETIVLPEKVWVNCRDKEYREECAIYVERTDKSRCISEGDLFWWQGCSAYWTPAFNRGKENIKCGKDYDIRLNRVGYSGVPRPELLKEKK